MAASYYSLYNPTTGIIAASYRDPGNNWGYPALQKMIETGLNTFDATELLDPQKWLILGGQKVARPVSWTGIILRAGNSNLLPIAAFDSVGPFTEIHVEGGETVAFENMDGNLAQYGGNVIRIEGPVMHGVKMDAVVDFQFNFRTPPGYGEYELKITTGNCLPIRVKIIAHPTLAVPNDGM